MSYVSSKDYKTWKLKISAEAQIEGVPEERLILSSFFNCVEQFVKSPTSIACASILDSARFCVLRYLSELETPE